MGSIVREYFLSSLSRTHVFFFRYFPPTGGRHSNPRKRAFPPSPAITYIQNALTISQGLFYAIASMNGNRGSHLLLFEDLVATCQWEAMIDVSRVSIYSAAIHAYEKKQPKSRREQTGNANWGEKFDSFGNKIKWFGYKLHLAIDTQSELPMALEVTPAHVNDGDMAPTLMEQIATRGTGRMN